MIDLSLPLGLAFIIFVWLKTSAVEDFFGPFLIPLNIIYMRDYSCLDATIKGNLGYPLWLYTKHPSFLTKLIACPLCLSFWTNLLLAQGFCNWNWVESAFITLLAFSALDKLYKHGV